jgi:hypothetical protein
MYEDLSVSALQDQFHRQARCPRPKLYRFASAHTAYLVTSTTGPSVGVGCGADGSVEVTLAVR